MKYRVSFSIELTGELEVDAASEEQAEAFANQILERGDYGDYIDGEHIEIQDVYFEK